MGVLVKHMNKDQADKVAYIYKLGNISCKIIQASYDNGKAPSANIDGTGNDIGRFNRVS